MTKIITYIIGAISVMIWCYFKWRNRHFEKLAARMQGPRTYPIIGTAYQAIGSPEHIMSKILDFLKEYNLGPIKIWAGPYFAVAVASPEDLQRRFSNLALPNAPTRFTLPLNKILKNRSIISTSNRVHRYMKKLKHNISL